MTQQTVVIASRNPAKIAAVESAFRSTWPAQDFTFVGYNAISGVAAQPMSSAETRLGARNRVADSQRAHPKADFYVGLEAGVEEGMTFAWMVIESKTQRGESRSASLMLPPAVAAELTPTNELGDVMDRVFATHNIKQRGGAIGLLTGHQLTRSSVYHQALVLALIPFINPTHFPTS
ncbi:inosine/xanthosine triphosphatase [Vibrio sp. SM6]|uniref:Inosine/xanthosine triphosphatase n=1 Tax=Vibrio agarilyticus TaxID=2726741 RepID=A0A7X8YGB1_9VIBR|nr:inosine/xanthosine triphosphatase [Vibrio agarilyticus]NLS12221.1 inosine/xanthosine triphosphatase [Vibrio agarilyticus]